MYDVKGHDIKVFDVKGSGVKGHDVKMYDDSRCLMSRGLICIKLVSSREGSSSTLLYLCFFQGQWNSETCGCPRPRIIILEAWGFLAARFLLKALAT